MIQFNKGKRIMATIIIGFTTLFIIAGCSSNKKPEALYKEADEIALKYAKAQYEYDLPVMFDLAPSKIQEDYLNDEKHFLYFKKRDGADNTHSVPIEHLIDPDKFKDIKEEYNNVEYNESHETFFQDFSSVEDDLHVVRFDHLFDTEGELAYFVKPWMEDSNDPNAGGKKRKSGFGHIKLKQNEDGEWKVVETTSGQFRAEGINTSDKNQVREIGAVVREPK